jgi:hypothetical protein
VRSILWTASGLAWTIAIFVLLTVVAAAAVLAPRLLPRNVTVDDVPDRPRAFGREMSWLAVQTDDVPRLAAVLGLADLSVANWNSGLGAIYDLELADSFVFISPPIRGWTLVASVALPLPAGGTFVDKMSPLLHRLSGHFSHFQYFATFPIIDFYAWAKFDGDSIVRAFAAGDGGTIWDLGRSTIEERRLGLSMFEVRGIRDRQGDIGGSLDLHPTEDHVLGVASGWSVNPMSIESLVDQGTGWVAYAPQSWRAERSRAAA